MEFIVQNYLDFKEVLADSVGRYSIRSWTIHNSQLFVSTLEPSFLYKYSIGNGGKDTSLKLVDRFPKAASCLTSFGQFLVWFGKKNIISLFEPTSRSIFKFIEASETIRCLRAFDGRLYVGEKRAVEVFSSSGILLSRLSMGIDCWDILQASVGIFVSDCLPQAFLLLNPDDILHGEKRIVRHGQKKVLHCDNSFIYVADGKRLCLWNSKFEKQVACFSYLSQILSVISDIKEFYVILEEKIIVYSKDDTNRPICSLSNSGFRKGIFRDGMLYLCQNRQKIVLVQALRHQHSQDYISEYVWVTDDDKDIIPKECVSLVSTRLLDYNMTTLQYVRFTGDGKDIVLRSCGHYSDELGLFGGGNYIVVHCNKIDSTSLKYCWYLLQSLVTPIAQPLLEVDTPVTLPLLKVDSLVQFSCQFDNIRLDYNNGILSVALLSPECSCLKTISYALLQANVRVDNVCLNGFEEFDILTVFPQVESLLLEDPDFTSAQTNALCDRLIELVFLKKLSIKNCLIWSCISTNLFCNALVSVDSGSTIDFVLHSLGHLMSQVKCVSLRNISALDFLIDAINMESLDIRDSNLSDSAFEDFLLFQPKHLERLDSIFLVGNNLSQGMLLQLSKRFKIDVELPIGNRRQLAQIRVRERQKLKSNCF